MMESKTTFNEYFEETIDNKSFYNFCISKNCDERIHKLLKTLTQDKLLQTVLDYPDKLYEQFKKSITHFYNLDDSRNLLLGSGTESIICILNNIILKDKKIAALTPHFYRVLETVKNLTLIESEISGDRLFVDLSNIQQDINDKLIEAIWIANPNSIVGFGYEKQTLLYLIKNNPNVLFLIDETNIDFYSSCKKLTMVSELKKFSNIVVLCSCSKFFGIPGARLGMLLTYNEDILTAYMKVEPTFPVSGLSIELASLAYKNYDFFRTLAKEIQVTRESITGLIQKADGVNVYPSLTNTLFLTSNKYNLWRKFEEKGILTMRYEHIKYKSSIRITIHSDEFLKKLLTDTISEIFNII